MSELRQRTCRSCGETKSLLEFYKTHCTQHLDAYSYECIFCLHERLPQTTMIGNLEPEERVLSVGQGGWLGQLSLKLEELNWNEGELEVVIAGTSAYEIEGTGTKWSPEKGTRKYDKDAFSIIRRPSSVTSSEDHSVLPHHKENTTENS